MDRIEFQAVRGLKKKVCPPIIRWMDTGWGGDFDPSASAQYEATSVVQKCAEAVVQHKTKPEFWHSGCVGNSKSGIGLLINQSQTPLFRCYSFDAYTNNRGEALCKAPKPGILYSSRLGETSLKFCKEYKQVASFCEKFVEKGYTECTVGNGRNPVKYSAVIVTVNDDSDISNLHKAEEIAIILGVPVIQIAGTKMLKSLFQ